MEHVDKVWGVISEMTILDWAGAPIVWMVLFFIAWSLGMLWSHNYLRGQIEELEGRTDGIEHTLELGEAAAARHEHDHH